jgi:hypothetical protein
MPVTNLAHPRHHFDRFADEFALRFADGDPDELLDTKAVAKLLHVSPQWLEIGRGKGYGPPWERLGPRLIRYRRSKVVKYIRSRPTGDGGRTRR